MSSTPDKSLISSLLLLPPDVIRCVLVAMGAGRVAILRCTCKKLCELWYIAEQYFSIAGNDRYEMTKGTKIIAVELI